MAPEYYAESYSTGVDIWAFGMSILEMITRTRPYYECGSNIGQIVDKVSKFILPQQLDAIEVPDVKEFISLCFKPADERPTATDLLHHKFFMEECENDNCPVDIGWFIFNFGYYSTVNTL